jgi:uncharacterized protein (TIGR00251 family)
LAEVIMASGLDMSQAVSAIADGVVLRIKVVPGASRSKIAGVLGDRLKVAVAAPPEGGKANRAACELLAEALGVPARDVSITEGHTQPRKTVQVVGINACAAVERLGQSVQRGPLGP